MGVLPQERKGVYRWQFIPQFIPLLVPRLVNGQQMERREETEVRQKRIRVPQRSYSGNEAKAKQE